MFGPVHGIAVVLLAGTTAATTEIAPPLPALSFGDALAYARAHRPEIAAAVARLGGDDGRCHRRARPVVPDTRRGRGARRRDR